MVGRDRTRSNFMRTGSREVCSAGKAPILFLADLSSQAEIHRFWLKSSMEVCRGSMS